MALPTLQPYWLKNYKNRNEGLLVRRTQFEAERREAWDNNARYFNRSNVETTKQRVWGSRESYEDRWDLQGYCKFYDLNAEIRTLFFISAQIDYFISHTSVFALVFPLSHRSSSATLRTGMFRSCMVIYLYNLLGNISCHFNFTTT